MILVCVYKDLQLNQHLSQLQCLQISRRENQPTTLQNSRHLNPPIILHQRRLLNQLAEGLGGCAMVMMSFAAQEPVEMIGSARIDANHLDLIVMGYMNFVARDFAVRMAHVSK